MLMTNRRGHAFTYSAAQPIYIVCCKTSVIRDSTSKCNNCSCFSTTWDQLTLRPMR